MQNYVCSLYGYIEGKKRYSKLYEKYLSHFTLTEWFDQGQIQNYKRSKISTLLIRAKKSPYYLQYLDGISAAQMFEEPYKILSKLPISTKEDIVNSYDAIVQRTEIKSYTVKTSGTTGKALKLDKTEDDIAAQWAVWARHLVRFDVNLDDVSVNFTGKAVVPSNQKKAPFWRYNSARKQYLISMQHINERNIGVIVGFLNTISPVYYSGYPSILAEVSRLAINADLTMKESSKPSYVFCGAENVLDYQKEAITHWTGAFVTDQYGLTEGNCNLSKCQYDYYHEDFEFSHFEIIDPELFPDGRAKGRLIGTSLFNTAFPLIRYDTGDVATMMPESFSCECGRKSRVIESIDGRIDDFVITNDGKRIMRFDYLFKDTFLIKEVQVIQKELGSIIILSVLREGADQYSYENLIKQRVIELINSDINVSFEYTGHIKKSSSGKFKAVLNLIENI